MKISRKVTLFVTFFIFFLCLGIVEKTYIKFTSDTEIIGSDGVGYYMYLPAIFIHHDLTFSFQPRQNKVFGNTINDYKIKTATAAGSSTTICKYTCGIALLELPFFSIAAGISYLTNYPIDGYNDFFQLSVFIAATFHVFVGFYFIWQLLNKLGFSAWVAVFAILCIGISTNLFYYVYYEPSMSHAFSFGMVSCFLHLANNLASKKNICSVTIIELSALLGIIILCRPVNGIIVLLVPFFFFYNKTPLKLLLSNRLILPYIIAVIVILAIIGIQLLIWYIQTGYAFVSLYTNPNEKFNFLSPHIADILFSYTKGLFVYSPILLIIFAGFWFLFEQNKLAASYLISFLFLVVYITSSWNLWTYMACFGPRPFIDFYPVATLLIALVLSNIKLFSGAFFGCFFICMTCINLIQSFQYKHEILLWDGMDKEKYWRVFLKTDRSKYSKLLSNELFFKNDTETLRRDAIDAVYSDPEWKKAYIEQARKEGVSLEIELEKMTHYLVSREIKKRSILHEMKAPEWRKSLEEKARLYNIPLDSVMKVDAEYMLETGGYPKVNFTN